MDVVIEWFNTPTSYMGGPGFISECYKLVVLTGISWFLLVGEVLVNLQGCGYAEAERDLLCL